MSEAVSNAEIEDVLSAVRRLVSQSGAVRREATDEVAHEKLVLTPAFRVDTITDPVAQEPSEKTDEQGFFAQEEAAEPAPVEDTQSDEPQVEEPSPAPSFLASVESLVQETVQDADHAPETSEDTTVEDVTSDVPEAPFEAVEDAPEAPTEAAAKPDSTFVTSLADRIAELESAVQTTDSEVYDQEDSDAPDEVVFRHAAAIEEPTPVEAVTTPVEEGAEDLSAEAQDVFSDEATIADEELLSVVDAVAADAWEDADTDEEADTSWDHTAESETIDAAADDSSDPYVIDEDMLREIVARLVREELQGTMGERITHNLRRMVRREIARALALRDLE